MTTPISKTYTQREWQTVALLGLIALTIVSYIYLVNRMVFHAVNRQTTNREITVLTDEVTNLENQTLTLGNRITMKLAYERGFLDPGTQTSYTTAKETTGLLVSWRDYGHE